MRGENTSQMDFLYNFSAEDRIPKSHPLRKIKMMADEALKKLDKEFDAMYADKGRASIPARTIAQSIASHCFLFDTVLNGNSANSSNTTFCSAGFWI